MQESYIEVRVTTNADPGDLYAALEDEGVVGAWEGEGIVRLYWAESRWRPGLVDKIRSVLEPMRPGDRGAEIIVGSIPDQDWNANWTRSITPIRIGRRVWVRQTWNSVDAPRGSIVVILDPKRAFGTGYHATTQLLIEALEEEELRGKSVLDVGTGSGILCMVAVRLGATRALGIDFDPEAVGCAREYASNNGFGPEISFEVGDASRFVGAEFDLLLANLDRNTLRRQAEKLRRMIGGGGILWISGILLGDEDDVRRAFTLAGLAASGRRTRDGWLALRMSAA